MTKKANLIVLQFKEMVEYVVKDYYLNDSIVNYSKCMVYLKQLYEGTVNMVRMMYQYDMISRKDKESMIEEIVEIFENAHDILNA